MPINWDALVLAPCENVFGEPATYTPAAGGSFSITGVFDRAYKEVGLIDLDIGANTVQPVLGVRAAQFPVPPVQGDMVFIPSVNITYYVRDVRPDGHGSIKLMLADSGHP
jgi:hypothetical protein